MAKIPERQEDLVNEHSVCVHMSTQRASVRKKMLKTSKLRWLMKTNIQKVQTVPFYNHSV